MKWLPTREALDYEANSPHQYLRECIGNSMKNMHTDVRVGRDKAQKLVVDILHHSTL